MQWYLKRKNLTAVPIQAMAPAAPPNLDSSFAGALDRLRRRKLELGTVIDVGASDGRWSAELMPLFPKTRFLCVEAQPAHEASLKTFVASHPQAEYALCAAGERTGETSFDATDLFGGWVQQAPGQGHSITVPIRTLDALVAERQLPAPYLIKLDTHGYELPILAGAAGIMPQPAALIVEVYNFTNRPPAVPFYEFCRVMAERGFRCIDLFDPLYRPLDAAFWQMDLVFMRDTRPEFQNFAFA